ncbi:MAG: MmgE/PrpD family protein [Rhodospirillaceae bacterium]|nr:MmgE/PrpD family protein [Rhodospirillaceae bacterium]
MEAPAILESTQTAGAATRRFSSFARNLQWRDIPEHVRHEAKRSLLNYFASAVAGSGEPAIDKFIATLERFGGAQNAGIIGRRERGDMLLAASVNAMSANIFDYDDTHSPTVIHPTAPIAPALFAYAETKRCDGRALLQALVLGIEIECRIGNAVSPSHYGRGWHITSTCGVFGAAMAVGALLGLTEEGYAWALGNASAQAAGLCETLGTMSKSISVGNAARNGIVSALLAADGFSGPVAPLEGPRGFLPVCSDAVRLEALIDGLGETWESAKNTYKPYPAGIVLHPVIEACLELQGRGAFTVDEVATVELTGATLLRQRTDRPGVTSGRESQVSAQHAVAIALRRGRAGLAEFSDEGVAEAMGDARRIKLRFIDDDSYDIEAARVVVHTHNGEAHDVMVSDARGGARNPMTDNDLEDKLASLVDWRGVPMDVEALTKAVWSLEFAPDAAAVMNLATIRA